MNDVLPICRPDLVGLPHFYQNGICNFKAIAVLQKKIFWKIFAKYGLRMDGQRTEGHEISSADLSAKIAAPPIEQLKVLGFQEEKTT